MMIILREQKFPRVKTATLENILVEKNIYTSFRSLKHIFIEPSTKTLTTELVPLFIF
jgi:hypothetical protein